MIIKLIRIYWALYRNLIFFNILFSFIAIITFKKGGFDRIGVYYLSLFIKAGGYGSTLLLNNLFYQKYSYFYKNLGISAKTIWKYFILSDLALYICLIFLSWLMIRFT